MMSEKLTKALNDQVNAEYYSAYLYLAMSAAAACLGLKGTSNWLFVQAKEEIAHGTHIYEYILERGAVPAFAAIEKPEISLKDIKEIFDMVYSHEQKVTQRINALASLAREESDHASYNFLMWYVDEQVEEEAGVTEILDKLRLIGDNKGMIFALDREFAGRVFNDPFSAKSE